MYLAIEDASGSIVLSGSGAIVGCTYFPAAPQRNDTNTFDDVVESGELVLRGTEAAIRSAVNTIERYFEQAYERQLGGRGARVYASYRPVATDTAWRSAKNEAWLTARGLVSRIHRRKPPGRPMALVVRTIGIARARVKIGLANLAYDMKRLVWLRSKAELA